MVTGYELTFSPDSGVGNSLTQLIGYDDSAANT